MQTASGGGATVPVTVVERRRGTAATSPAMAPSGWGPPGRSCVTAILVVHNGMDWLPRTLAAVGAQQRPPDRIIAVDTGSDDGSAEALASCDIIDEVLAMPPSTCFGEAIAAAERTSGRRLDLDAESDAGPESEPEAGRSAGGTAGGDWLWLLHDDCAPEPHALSALVAKGDADSSIAVLGPKVRGWHDEGLLLECGLSITASGRRFTGLEVGDRDQGQRDDGSDVLAVGSAGMLVRRAVWSEVGGFDPGLPMFGDDLDFCMRVRRSDQRVVVVPSAVVHHREAALHGVRRLARPALPASLAGRSAALYTALVHGPILLLPLTSTALFLRTMVNALLLLFIDGPARSWAELRIWGQVHLHPIRVLRARRRLRSVATVPRKDLDDLRPSRREQWVLGIERVALRLRTLTGPGGSTGPLDLGSAAAVAAALAIVAAAATRSVWIAQGHLLGGALLPPTDGTTLWESFRMAWHDVGLGSGEPAAAYPLALIALAAPPVVSVDHVVSVLLLFTVPLAALSAFLALRGLPMRGGRAALAVAYGLTPAVVVPSLDGRLGTAVVAIALPWLVRLGLRLLGGASVAAALPPPRMRTAAAATILLAVCASFAPLVWVAAVALVVPVALLRARSARQWLGVAVLIGMPVLLLWPWSGALIADPGRAMFEAGVSSPELVAATPPGWRLLLLDPGTLASQAGGIATLGTGTLLVAAPLVAAAAVALMWQPSRGLAVWGWAMVLVGLLCATVQTTGTFVPIGSTTAQHGFAGPMVVLMAAGMVVAVAGLLLAPAPRRIPTRALTAGFTAALVAGPVVLAAIWTTDLNGPLRRSADTLLPAFVAVEASSPDRIRVLLLEEGPEGAVAYSLVNGNGARLGDADVAPPAAQWAPVSAAVSALAAGVGSEPVEALAAQAVRYIAADTQDESIAAALDGNPSLRRLSTTDGRALWKVSGITTRARVQSADGESGPAPMLTPRETIDTMGTILDAPLASPGPGAVLVIAQSDDGLWTAVVDQAVVDQAGVDAGDGAGLVVDLPQEATAHVVVNHEQGARDRALLYPAVGMAVVLLLLLPSSRLRRSEEDPDTGAPRPGPAEGTLDLTDAKVTGPR